MIDGEKELMVQGFQPSKHCGYQYFVVPESYGPHRRGIVKEPAQFRNTITL
jgi:hypothetical protein